MNCKEYAFLQPQYLDGDLDAATAEEIRAHLAKCPSCRRLQEEAKKLFSVLPQIEDMEIPQGLEADIFHAVRKGPKREKQGFHIPRFLRAWQFYSVPAACILIYTVLYGLSGANLPRADETLTYTVTPPEKIHSFLPELPAAWPFQREESPEPSPASTGASGNTSAQIVTPAQTQTATTSAESDASPKVAQEASAKASPSPAPSFSISGGRRPSASATSKPDSKDSETKKGNTPEEPVGKTYPTVSSLVKRAITFVVEDEAAADVFQKNKNKGEQAVRSALSRAGFHFTTRESVVEEYASSYNALAKDATMLSARIAKGETALSDLLSEKEWKMQTMKEECAKAELRIAYQ